MTNQLKSALALARRGFRVFRLQAGSKRPLKGDEWTKTATSNPTEVFELWAERDYNIGVLADGLVIVDCDVKGGLDGVAAYGAFDAAPNTFAVDTPSGGRHYYYRAEDAYSQAPLAPGIDIRSGNGYVLGPGSIIDGKPYVIVNKADVAPLPKTVADGLALRHAGEATSASMVEDRDTPEQLQAAKRYLETRAPEAEQAARTNISFKVAEHLFDIGLTLETVEEFLGVWNAIKCSPPLSDAEIAKQSRDAERYRQLPVGWKSPTLGFSPVPYVAPQPVAAKPQDLLRWPHEYSVAQIVAREKEAIIRGLMYRQEDIWCYGHSGAGKSFVALNLGFHIAMGKKWNGRDVRQSPVLYLGLEGQGGIPKRILAAGARYGDPGLFFASLVPHVDFGAICKGSDKGAEHAETLIRAYELLCQRAGYAGSDGVIIVDTYAQAMAGTNENDAEFAGQFVRLMRDLRAKTGATTLTIHHAGKSGDMRGSTVFRGAADAILRVEKAKGEDGGGPFNKLLTVEKCKDGEDGQQLAFRLEQMTLGTLGLQEEITSCVIDWDTPAARQKLQAEASMTPSATLFGLN